MDRGAWKATVHGVTKVGHNLASRTETHLHFTICFLYVLCLLKISHLFPLLPFLCVIVQFSSISNANFEQLTTKKYQSL